MRLHLVSVIVERMHKVAIQDVNAIAGGSAASARQLPVVTRQISLGENSCGVDLNAEMKKFEEELLESEQDEKIRQQSMKLERLKQEVETKEKVRKLRGKKVFLKCQIFICFLILIYW